MFRLFVGLPNYATPFFSHIQSYFFHRPLSQSTFFKLSVLYFVPYLTGEVSKCCVTAAWSVKVISELSGLPKARVVQGRALLVRVERLRVVQTRRVAGLVSDIVSLGDVQRPGDAAFRWGQGQRGGQGQSAGEAAEGGWGLGEIGDGHWSGLQLRFRWHPAQFFRSFGKLLMLKHGNVAHRFALGRLGILHGELILHGHGCGGIRSPILWLLKRLCSLKDILPRGVAVLGGRGGIGVWCRRVGVGECTQLTAELLNWTAAAWGAWGCTVFEPIPAVTAWLFVCNSQSVSVHGYCALFISVAHAAAPLPVWPMWLVQADLNSVHIPRLCNEEYYIDK